MKRLIMALFVAGMLFGTIWVLNAALPLTGGAAESDPATSGDSFDGISFMGGP